MIKNGVFVMSKIDFEKYNNEYIEGFLTDREHFNGVLFLLREPNTDKQTEFWFKKSLKNDSSQRSFRLYRNKFNIYLEYLGGNYNLSECAYANVRPIDGENYKSDEFKKLNNQQIFERFKYILDCCGSKVKYVFTCNDIFSAICEENKLQQDEIKESIIQYRKSNVRKRYIEFNGVIVFEIYHPSYTKYPKRVNEI